MSHSKERAEKICLNCNAQLSGRFCHICGQENLEPKESVWHLVTHFFNDVTHFDGKFFSTLKYLVFKPGFLSREYMNGRRASYLNPVRMYIFSSALFFLIFFNFLQSDNFETRDNSIQKNVIDSIKKMDKVQMDSLALRLFNTPAPPKTFVDSYIDSLYNPNGVNINGKVYHSLDEYRNAIKTGNSHPNWLLNKFVEKVFQLKKRNKLDKEYFKNFLEAFRHGFPQLFFISLPLVALFLKLIYFRRKQFYYTNHLIFTVHLYIFYFIAMLIIVFTTKMKDTYSLNFLNYLLYPLYFSLFIYLYKALRNFYQQGRRKTFFKMMLLLFSFLFLLVMLVGIFLIYLFFYKS